MCVCVFIINDKHSRISSTLYLAAVNCVPFHGVLGRYRDPLFLGQGLEENSVAKAWNNFFTLRMWVFGGIYLSKW